MQRILMLDRRLRAGRPVVAKTVAAELGVDEKTIRRDLTQVMRDQYRLPVVYDRTRREWSYGGPAEQLPATLVSSEDRLALLLSLQATEQFRGTPVHEKLLALHERLLETLVPETRTAYTALAAKVRFEGPPVPPLSTAVWQTVMNAVDDETTLFFSIELGATVKPASGW
jgi:predicted DNA-binding transcriptional regulator YafY